MSNVTPIFDRNEIRAGFDARVARVSGSELMRRLMALENLIKGIDKDFSPVAFELCEIDILAHEDEVMRRLMINRAKRAANNG